MGNNQNIHIGGTSQGRITQEINVNSKNNSGSLPDKIDEKQLKEFLEFLKAFLASESADDLTRKDIKETKKIIGEVEAVECRSGWMKIRDYLSNTANATTIISAMAGFTTAQGLQIAEWIRNLPLFQ